MVLLLPDAIAPWAALAINLRLLYFDDEWAGSRIRTERDAP
jgi:hypothetical protein